MRPIFHRSRGKTYECRLLGDNDLGALNLYRRLANRDIFKKAGIPDELTEEMIAGTSAAEAPLNTRQRAYFGLFDDYKMIGETSIALGRRCTFTGSHILSDYSGKKLANMLYDIRITYLLYNSNIDLAYEY